MKVNKQLQAIIFEIIGNQIRDADPSNVPVVIFQNYITAFRDVAPCTEPVCLFGA